MATGQILLQRFYYSKSLVKHDVEVSLILSFLLSILCLHGLPEIGEVVVTSF